MRRTVLGTFENTENVDSVLEKLKDKNYTAEEVSVITKEENIEIETDASQNIGQGAKVGALAGGLVGLLAGLGVLAIPGLGALFIAGPIVAALGITGVLGVTASGALTGALAGGLVGALKEIGVDERLANEYEESVRNGETLLGVLAKENDTERIKEIMEEENGNSVADIAISKP